MAAGFADACWDNQYQTLAIVTCQVVKKASLLYTYGDEINVTTHFSLSMYKSLAYPCSLHNPHHSTSVSLLK